MWRKHIKLFQKQNGAAFNYYNLPTDRLRQLTPTGPTHGAPGAPKNVDVEAEID